MEEVDAYITIAKAAGEAGFVKQFDHLFLLRAPVAKQNVSLDKLLGAASSHRTSASHVDPAEVDRLAELDREPAWRVAKVKARTTDALVVGRLASCDVMIGLPSVSKEHARFLIAQGKVVQLVDIGSTNGTFVNGVQTKPWVPVDVKVGDAIRFGGVETKLVNAQTFFEVLSK